MDAASKAYQAAMMAQNKGMLDAAAKGQATDADAKVRVETNSRYEYLQVAGQVAVGPGITGYHVKGSGDNQGTTWVFLGPWQISKDGSSTRFQLPQLTGPSCSVVTVKVQVEADQARAKGILEKVDWAALKALIKELPWMSPASKSRSPPSTDGVVTPVRSSPRATGSWITWANTSTWRRRNAAMSPGRRTTAPTSSW
jgi:hypothetical protein